MNLWRRLIQAWLGPATPPRHARRRHGSRPSGQRRLNHRRPPRASKRRPPQGLRRLLKGLSSPRLIQGRVIAYHGTPSASNARSIFRDGFMAGGGNALGDGIYLATDLTTAKTYAGSTGVYLKCLVKLGRTCFWGPPMQARYAAWCQRRGVRQDNSAMTAFLLQHGYNTLQNGKVVVVLAPQFANPSAWKRKNRHVKLLSVHRASDGVRIKV